MGARRCAVLIATIALSTADFRCSFLQHPTGCSCTERTDEEARRDAVRRPWQMGRPHAARGHRLDLAGEVQREIRFDCGQVGAHDREKFCGVIGGGSVAHGAVLLFENLARRTPGGWWRLPPPFHLPAGAGGYKGGVWTGRWKAVEARWKVRWKIL